MSVCVWKTCFQGWLKLKGRKGIEYRIYLHGLKKPGGSIDCIIDYNCDLNRRNLIHKSIFSQLHWLGILNLLQKQSNFKVRNIYAIWPEQWFSAAKAHRGPALSQAPGDSSWQLIGPLSSPAWSRPHSYCIWNNSHIIALYLHLLISLSSQETYNRN